MLGLETFSPEDGQKMFFAVSAFCAYALVAVAICFFTDFGLRVTRLLATSVLIVTGFVSLLCSYLYIWHHYYRT